VPTWILCARTCRSSRTTPTGTATSRFIVNRSPNCEAVQDAAHEGLGGWSSTFQFMWRTTHDELRSAPISWPMKVFDHMPNLTHHFTPTGSTLTSLNSLPSSSTCGLFYGLPALLGPPLEDGSCHSVPTTPPPFHGCSTQPVPKTSLLVISHVFSSK
jgi:hypothetical protein